MKRTVPNRAFDHLYDPVYTSGTTRGGSDINDENDDENEADEAERTAHAITILQKLLRGRAVQNIMYEGVSENRDLIAELRHEDDRVESVGISSSSKNDEDEVDVQWQHNEVIQSTREKLVGEILSSAVESLRVV